MNELTLLDWKRRIFELYEEIRASDEPERALAALARRARRALPRAPAVAAAARAARGVRRRAATSTTTLSLRVLGAVEPAERERREIATSGEQPYSFTRFARVRFELAGAEHALDLLLARRLRRRALPLLRRRDERHARPTAPAATSSTP